VSDIDPLTNRLAGNAVDIEMAADRLSALEMAVSWLLAQHPNDAGLRFVRGQASQIEGEGGDPGVVAELGLLGDLVSCLIERKRPS
jgi:hypothetical protein